MADNDFELDPETLRRIEEEARKEVEADFELDEETLRQIEREALREAGLLDEDETPASEPEPAPPPAPKPEPLPAPKPEPARPPAPKPEPLPAPKAGEDADEAFEDQAEEVPTAKPAKPSAGATRKRKKMPRGVKGPRPPQKSPAGKTRPSPRPMPQPNTAAPEAVPPAEKPLEAPPEKKPEVPAEKPADKAAAAPAEADSAGKTGKNRRHRGKRRPGHSTSTTQAAVAHAAKVSATTHLAQAENTPGSRNRLLLILVVVLIAILIVLGVVWYATSRPSDTTTGPAPTRTTTVAEEPAEPDEPTPEPTPAVEVSAAQEWTELRERLTNMLNRFKRVDETSAEQRLAGIKGAIADLEAFLEKHPRDEDPAVYDQAQKRLEWFRDKLPLYEAAAH